jgi:hypothetical protein
MTNGRIGMSDIAEAVDLREITERLDWAAVERQLDEEGFAATGPLLSAEQCREVVEIFDDGSRYRSTITMARHAFGEGRYRYFDDPLPELVQQLREWLYPPLAAIANPLGRPPRRARLPRHTARAAGGVCEARAAQAHTAGAALRPRRIQQPAPGRLPGS